MIFRYQITEAEIKVNDFLRKVHIPAAVIASFKNHNGQLLVNDQTVSGAYILKRGDLLEVVFPSSSQGDNISSVKGPLDIVYEDAYLLIVNKQPNLATIPTREHFNNSLANFIMSYYKRNGIEANIHFVSRLDAPTSGLIMLAKNSYMLTLLKTSQLEKHYLLEVVGNSIQPSGIIETGIEKDPESIIKRKITALINSKTIYQRILVKEETCIIDATLCTGKTHQLRLHFSNMGYPIVGDSLYGTQTNDGILHLHSYQLSFIHPITKKNMSFTSYPLWYQNS